MRVLLVEDSAQDAELEIRELRRAGIALRHLVVATEEGFRDALANFTPDVILSDFSMPHFDGMEALAIARKEAATIPFIFVSGTIGEEYAIRALKNGATDYVLKSNLVRLPPTVERALEDARKAAERRAADERLRESEERFRGILNAAADGIAVIDRDGRLHTLNPQFATIFGYLPEELSRRDVADLIPDLNATNAAGLGDYFSAPDLRQSNKSPSLGVCKDGTQIDVALSLSLLSTRAGLMMICIVRDVSRQMEQEARLGRLSRMRDLVGAVSSAILRLRDAQTLFQDFCHIAVSRAGFLAAAVIAADGDPPRLRIAAQAGKVVVTLDKTVEAYNEDPTGAQSPLATAVRSSRPDVSSDALTDERPGRREWYRQAGINSVARLPILLGDQLRGVILLYAAERDYFDSEELALLKDLIGNLAFALELMDNRAKLDHLVYFDSLTELPNRELFSDRLARALEAAHRTQDKVAVILLDVERFRTINDAFGRAAGDQLLRRIARRVIDLAQGSERAGRILGDRFGFLVPAVRDAAQVGSLLEDCSAANLLDGMAEIDGRELHVAVKAGIVLAPEDGTNAETLLRNAEAALKKAKSVAERYVFYSPEINARVAERLSLEARLRGALERAELLLHYQPKVDTVSRSVTGVEALLRWQSTEAQLIPPARFIPILEETGLILEVGRWIMRHAVETYRSWLERGLAARRIAVNVSAIQLHSGTFVKDVLAALGADVGDACGLDLEITESLLMQDIEASMQKLREVRALGVRIALDDFGTGYSSLAYLARLPIDALKIDRAFVHGATRNTNDASIVSGIISLAKSLNLKVVAEGVETEQQADFLSQLRCDELQGYLTGRPVPAEVIVQRLRT